jgi:phosphomannomutase
VKSWLRPDGIRATYLNELARPGVLRLAEIIAAMLWEDLGGYAANAPILVVGRDGRSMSADLQAGAVAGLRRMGCHVIEVGEVTRPEFWFAVRHLESFAGVWINGVGTDANCGGLDVFQGGRCWSFPGRLEQLWNRRDEKLNRPSARNGTLATFQTTQPYLAGLRKHFHAFRPLSILLSTREPKLREYLQTLLDESPIIAEWHTALTPPTAPDNAERPLPDDIQARLYAQRLDAVIAIDDDAQTCWAWDERGRYVPSIHLLRPLHDLLERRRMNVLTRQPQSSMDSIRHDESRLGPDWLRARTAHVRSQDGLEPAPKAKPTLSSALSRDREPVRQEAVHGGRPSIVIADAILPEGGLIGADVVVAGDTLETISAAMSEHRARLGLDARGAFWFDDSGPTSDALLTIARILQLLSQSDQSLSRIWAE